MSSLVRTEIGLWKFAIIWLFYRLSKSGDAVSLAETQSALEAKIPYMLHFLGNEDDDISGAVSEFAQEYISMLKTSGSLSPTQRNHIEVSIFIFIFVGKNVNKKKSEFRKQSRIISLNLKITIIFFHVNLKLCIFP